MQEHAIRGGPREARARPGCFIAGAGVVAVLALSATPGVYPAVALFLTGLAAWVAERLRAGGGLSERAVRLEEALAYGGIALPLLAGLPAAARAEPPALRAVWIA